MSVRFSNTKGFTLTEIISVVTMLGIISLIILSSDMTDRSELGREKDIAKAHLNYARYMALSNDIDSWGIGFSANSYTLTKAGNPTTFPLPGENASTHTLPAGITIVAPVSIVFDAKGAASTSDQMVSFGDKNGNTETITITKNTGFVR